MKKLRLCIIITLGIVLSGCAAGSHYSNEIHPPLKKETKVVSSYEVNSEIQPFESQNI